MKSKTSATGAGRAVNLAGEEHLYFGGTSYLGLQTDPEFQKLLCDQIAIWGTNLGASRNANLKLSIFEEFESAFARWCNSPACISLSSGYLAGQLLAAHFASAGLPLIFAPDTHSALIPPKSQLQPSYEALIDAVKYQLDSAKAEKVVLFFDTVDFSGFDYPQFRWLDELDLERCILVADDSHGIGICGHHGRGCYQALSAKQPAELLICCSLGKALATPAGTVLGNQQRVEQLRKSPIYGGASPASPAALAALHQAIPKLKTKYDQVQSLIDNFLEALEFPGQFKAIPAYPCFVYSDPGLTAFLLEHKVLVTDFSYPTESDERVSRLVLSAAHEKADVQKLADLINGYFSS